MYDDSVTGGRGTPSKGKLLLGGRSSVVDPLTTPIRRVVKKKPGSIADPSFLSPAPRYDSTGYATMAKPAASPFGDRY